MDYKQAILDALEVMRKKSVADKETFKARAYSKVANQIKELPSVSRYEDVAGVTGIGEKIRDKILEILATGQLAAANRAKGEYHLDATETFLKIYGVGPAKAKEIVDAGIYTIDGLRAEFARIEKVTAENASKKKSDKVKIPKYYNENTVIGLKYYEALVERIPRAEMLQHNAYLRSMMPPEFPFQIEIVGSFRRQAESSGDIDVLIQIPHGFDPGLANLVFKNYIEKLQITGYINEILAIGEHKCMAICTGVPGKHRRLDLLLTPYHEYAYSILYFTGSDKFNVAFRQHALGRGYSLNEHSMTPIMAGVAVPPIMNSEKDIFAFLGLKYIEPHMRIDGAQIISV